ncbi:MAG: hypothetical protein AABY32_06195 [Nanoarchaeota archaeon]
MDSTKTAEKENVIDKIYILIKKGEEKREDQRGEAINLLGEAWSLYENLLQQRGKLYINKNCPDIHAKLKGLVNKLIEYNS